MIRTMCSRDAAKLGVYVMPGPATDTLAAKSQAAEAERIGLGAIWLSELQGPMKDAGAVLGYLACATDRVRLGTSVSQFGTRHPLVLASWGATMQALSAGRFEMGFGRSVADVLRTWGVPVPTTKSMGDYADILRRLWNHETVAYDGPAGSFPQLNLGDFPDFEPPPLLLAAIGPNSMDLVGRAFDGVLMHPFTSIEGIVNARTMVREAAERAGRDPETVRIIYQVATAPDCTDEQVDQRVRARVAAYLSNTSFGNLMAAANGWDLGPIEAMRAEVAKIAGLSAHTPSGRQALIEPSRVLPQRWLDESAAIGTAAECAAKFHDFLDAGADEIVIHGTTAEGLEATIDAFTASE
jgi:5,10-methylenetetrahydromethanopterin reductase